VSQLPTESLEPLQMAGLDVHPTLGQKPHHPPRHKQHLAALELQVLLAALAEKAPGTRPGGEVIRLRSNFLNAIKRMPSGWTKPEQACPHAQGPATDKPSRGVSATQAW
jgi:hypothetical protein